ncbi:MAG: transglutaminase family protein [Nitrospiria bacterium]
MKTPPFLLGFTLLFWGWRVDLLPLASMIAAACEGGRFIPWKWEPSRDDFRRIWDVSAILFLGVIAYIFTANQLLDSILIFIQWLPFLFAPIVIAQIYSPSEKISIDTFYIVLRKRVLKGVGNIYSSFNLTYPFLLICLLAAGGVNDGSYRFYIGLILFSAWALWPLKSERCSFPVWISSFILVGVLGYWGHTELRRLQVSLENLIIEWMSLEGTDPYRSTTAIGDIRTLKESGRILFRVDQPVVQKGPVLLREASYNLYQPPLWLASNAGFRPVQSERNGTTWTLRKNTFINKELTVEAVLKTGQKILPLPNSTYRIEDLPVTGMKRNGMGDVKVDFGSGFVSYRARYDQNASFDRPPNKLDLFIPLGESEAVKKIATELELHGSAPSEVLEKLNYFFQNTFRYSLRLEGNSIEEFLFQSRSGHCEYFATATVLLLREAGIPARYATGFSVQEYNPNEDKFVVRERHAHAWALAYIDGVWRNVDNTPSTWASIEASSSSMLEPLRDLWSRGVFLFSKWRGSEKDFSLITYFGWPFAILFGSLFWQFFLRKRVTRFIAQRKDRRIKRYIASADSDFYLIVRKLHALGLGREPGEPLSAWIKRVDRGKLSSESLQSLQSILALHYRHRFGPEQLSPKEKMDLKRRVKAWLSVNKVDLARS